LEIQELTALEIGELIKTKKISCIEAAKVFLEAAKRDFEKPKSDETKLNAFTEIYEKTALSAAENAQKRIDNGEHTSPLAGVPIVIKDNICTAEGYTTAASKMLQGFRSTFDAGVIEKIKDAGIVITGKTNLDEFALGSSTENSCYGTVRNPWEMSHVPGGSSGGSTAAVAAGLAPLALGSDTGGSGRVPCGFCNLTGIKPTYGSVSRYGLIACAPSLDQVGPIALDARDCAAALSVISGNDKRDSTSATGTPFDFSDMFSKKTLENKMTGLKIGIPKEHFEHPLLKETVKTRVLQATETMRSLGAEIVEIKMPLFEYTMPAYLIIACAEICSSFARFDGVKYGYRSPNAKTLEEVYSKSRGEGFGDEVKRRILFGYFVLSHGNFEKYFRQAQRVRGMIQKEYDNALENLDHILTPASFTTAYSIGERADNPLDMYQSNSYTASQNLTGLPGAVAPCGFSDEGMPIGMQLIGKKYSDGLLLDTIARYQAVTDHHKKRPAQNSGSQNRRSEEKR